MIVNLQQQEASFLAGLLRAYNTVIWNTEKNGYQIVEQHCSAKLFPKETATHNNQCVHVTLPTATATKAELIDIAMKNFKIEKKAVKLISFYRSQIYNVSDFINMIDDILNDFAQNPLVIVDDSATDLFNNDLPTTFLIFDCNNQGDIFNSLSTTSHLPQHFCPGNIGIRNISNVIFDIEMSKRLDYGKVSSQFVKQCGVEIAPFLFSYKEKCNPKDAVSNIIRYTYNGLDEVLN
uniref:Uncharacterized protein n=1 Tax=Glossina pallidipes TaxID=7398 RepID=A0A1A9ZWN4_GLOPL